ncbi:hypothetical protein Sjap_000333 [Stephania japonica]|uniref:Uncharacterized protein n=1 Tax=Stephania japonica TaxID=461633 RepID=A0AAP0KJF1_9MAGN
MALEVDMILGFIQQQGYTSMDELHRGMEQLFVDMVSESESLVQLPGIVIKEIIESSPEDLENRLRNALKIVSRIDKELEGLLQWSFPIGNTITSLVTDAAMVGDERATLESNSGKNLLLMRTQTTRFKSWRTRVACHLTVVRSAGLFQQGPRELASEIEKIVSTDIVTELVKNFDWVSRESNHVTKEEMIEEEYLHKGLKCREGVVLDEWTLRKSGEDMKRLIAKSVAKVPNHLIKLLHQTPPSTQEYSLATLLKTHEHYHTDISSLSMVVLAGFATLSMPSSRSQCILGSLDEVFEILFYIDQRLPTTSLFERKTSCANKVWRFKEFFGTLFEKTKSEVVASQLQIDQVIEDLESVAGKLTSLENYPIAHEVEVISCFIRHEAYTSMDELHKGMEQLFVDMLSEHLVQLPGIIFKDIIGSSLEDMEKKLRDALKVVSRIDKKLEGVLQWSFPVGSTITSLVTEAATSMDGEDNGNTIAIDVNSNEIPVTENHSSVSFEDASGKKNYTLRFTTGEGDISSIVSAAAQDEVIEIE